MKQFVPLLCLTLLFLSGALSSVAPVLPEDCNATVFQAGLALEEINKDRDEAYVFALYRVADAHRQHVGAGNIYYFTIDVVETDCHIISGKSWKNCNLRPFHETAFGQCKVIFYLSLPWRRVKLYSYNCILGPVPKSLVSSVCPDCPTGSESPLYEPIADTMVAKYNKESINTQYYKVYMVENSKMQWVNGPSYFVEFIIKETNCSKSETQVADCHFLEDEQACRSNVVMVPALGLKTSWDVEKLKRQTAPARPTLNELDAVFSKRRSNVVVVPTLGVKTSWDVEKLKRQTTTGILLHHHPTLNELDAVFPKGAGNIYYFTIDVVETDCHLVSRKSAKDCKLRPFLETAFGQCKVIFYLSLPWRRVKLYSYNCILGPVPKSLVSSMCPDCPIGSDLPLYEPIADTMVAKYNKESNNTQYYKVYMVENSKMQWMNGPSYFVEIIIKETNCSKSETHVADCHFLEDEQARLGFCKGSQIRRFEEDEISVSCEIYGPMKLSLPRFRHHEKFGQDHGEVSIFHKHKFDTSGKIVRLPEDQQHYHKEKHEEKHGHGSPSGEPQDQPTKKPDEGSSLEHTGLKPIPPPSKGPVGTVEYYHMINETDVFPSPSNPVPSHPIVPPESYPGQEAVEPKHPIVPGVIGPFQDPEPQPFPLHPSDSAGCPSDPTHMLHHIASLLPKP